MALLPGSAALLAPTGNEIRNFAVTAQTPAATVRTNIAGGNLAIPNSGLKVGARIRWRFNMTKTAAGSAASTFDIAFGTTGTIADTARVSFTKPAGTAAVDEGYVCITATVRSVGAAGVVVGDFEMYHNLAATGHATIPCVNVNTVSAGFANNLIDTIISLNITTGAADAITIQTVQSELLAV